MDAILTPHLNMGSQTNRSCLGHGTILAKPSFTFWFHGGVQPSILGGGGLDPLTELASLPSALLR